MYADDQKAKQEAANQESSGAIRSGTQPYYGAQCGQAVQAKRPSLREEAEHGVGYHRTQADKHDRAAAFLREHPEFDEFVQLVRAGVIQF
jgi:hypothetical protein